MKYINSPTSTRFINLDKVDYRLLLLVYHYHTLYLINHPHYYKLHNIWIVKPLASSRGAGISILKDNEELYSSPSNAYFHYKNIKKYENKLIQDYIANPLLLRSGPFAERKFDIRQWVLVVSSGNRPRIYRYKEGYCRFAGMKYRTDRIDS